MGFFLDTSGIGDAAQILGSAIIQKRQKEDEERRLAQFLRVSQALSDVARTGDTSNIGSLLAQEGIVVPDSVTDPNQVISHAVTGLGSNLPRLTGQNLNFFQNLQSQVQSRSDATGIATSLLNSIQPMLSPEDFSSLQQQISTNPEGTADLISEIFEQKIGVDLKAREQSILATGEPGFTGLDIKQKESDIIESRQKRLALLSSSLRGQGKGGGGGLTDNSKFIRLNEMRAEINTSVKDISNSIETTEKSIRDRRTALTDQASITSPEIIGLINPVFTNDRGQSVTALDIDQMARSAAFKSQVDNTNIDPFSVTRDLLIQGGFISGTPEENEQVLDLLINHGIATSTQAGEEAALSQQVQNELNIIAQEQTRLDILKEQRSDVQRKQLEFDQGLRNAVQQGLVFEDPVTGALFGTSLEATQRSRVSDIPLATGLPGTLVPTAQIEKQIQESKPEGNLQKIFDAASRVGEDVSNLFKDNEGAQRQLESLRGLSSEPGIVQKATQEVSESADAITETVVDGVVNSISTFTPEVSGQRLSPGAVVENVSSRVTEQKGRPVTIEERKRIIEAIEKRNRELDSQAGGLR